MGKIAEDILSRLQGFYLGQQRHRCNQAAPELQARCNPYKMLAPELRELPLVESLKGRQANSTGVPGKTGKHLGRRLRILRHHQRAGQHRLERHRAILPLQDEIFEGGLLLEACDLIHNRFHR